MKPFNQTIAELRRGKTVEELTDAMAELVAKCTETGKGGSLQLTIKIAPGKSGQLEITDSIKVSVPQFARESSLFFVTPEGNLSRNDPRQDELPGIRSANINDTADRKVG